MARRNIGNAGGDDILQIYSGSVDTSYSVRQDLWERFEEVRDRLRFSQSAIHRIAIIRQFDMLLFGSFMTISFSLLFRDASAQDFRRCIILWLCIALRAIANFLANCFNPACKLHGAHDPVFTVDRHHHRMSSDGRRKAVRFTTWRTLELVILSSIDVAFMTLACRFCADEMRRWPEWTLTELLAATESKMVGFYLMAALHGLCVFHAFQSEKVWILLFCGSYSLHYFCYGEMVQRETNAVWMFLRYGITDSGLYFSDILSALFSSLAQLHRQDDLDPSALRLYNDLAVFVFTVPRRRGLEAARIALLSDDGYLRKAAVNLVRVWVDMDILEEARGHESSLLSALAQVLQDNILDTGRVAAQCFETLGRRSAARILRIESATSKQKLVHILIKLKTKEGSEEYTKALIPLLQLSERMNDQDLEFSLECSEENFRELMLARTQILQRGSVSENATPQYASADAPVNAELVTVPWRGWHSSFYILAFPTVMVAWILIFVAVYPIAHFQGVLVLLFGLLLLHSNSILFWYRRSRIRRVVELCKWKYGKGLVYSDPGFLASSQEEIHFIVLFLVTVIMSVCLNYR